MACIGNVSYCVIRQIVDIPFANFEISTILSGIDTLSINSCSGCTCIIHRNEYEEIESIEILLDNGTPLNLKAKYTIAINSYMASVYGFDRHKGKVFAHSNEMTFDFLKKHPHINYAGVTRLK